MLEVGLAVSYIIFGTFILLSQRTDCDFPTCVTMASSSHNLDGKITKARLSVDDWSATAVNLSCARLSTSDMVNQFVFS